MPSNLSSRSQATYKRIQEKKRVIDALQAIIDRHEKKETAPTKS
jgi:hypothetical protein